MNLVSYATSIFDVNIIADSGLKEVIVSCKELSRIQKTSYEDLLKICSVAKQLQLKVVLEWDILICEDDFEKYTNLFQNIPTDLYDAVRVQDAGVLQWCLEHSNKPIQFITETGNHNLTSLKTWRDYIGSRLERLVLSVELNREKLAEYANILDCQLEVLALGRILLFYTPRKLLSTLIDSDDKKSLNPNLYQDFIEATGESEESPHKGFPLLENQHGTFMFHIKDLFLLDRIEELTQTGITYARIDLRFNDIRLLQKITSVKNNEQAQAVKALYGVDVIRGYFNVNKSDVLFKKLKNYRIQRKDASYIGEVLEAQKSDYMAILIKGDTHITKDSELKFVTPEGKEHFCKVHILKNSCLEDIDTASKGQLALINYMSGVWTKSQVYLQ